MARKRGKWAELLQGQFSTASEFFILNNKKALVSLLRLVHVFLFLSFAILDLATCDESGLTPSRVS